WRIKCDPEWFVERAFCKNFGDIGFSIAIGVAQHLDLVCATLDDKDVAIWRGEQEPWVAKSAGIQFGLEPRRNFGSRVAWAVYDTRPINCQSIRPRLRQILNRNFARDTRRIACPVAHGGFAREELAVFGGRSSSKGDDGNGREHNRAGNRMSRSALSHCS